MSIEFYCFENKDGESVTDWHTQDVEEARQYAQENKCRLIARIFEFTDSELVESYCEGEDVDGEPTEEEESDAAA